MLRATNDARPPTALATEFTRLPRGGTREFAFLAGVFPTNRAVAPEEST